MTLNPTRSTSPTMEEDCSPEEQLAWKDKLLKALDGQSINTGPLWYTFTQRFVTYDAKATFNQATLDIGIHTVDNFNKILLEMTKHAFSAHALREQKRYLRRHLVKPRSMKLRSFITRLQELNAYLEAFSPGTKGQETAPLPADEIIDIVYHSMPTTWKKKMIEQGFNYPDSIIKEMTNVFENRVEKLGAQ